MLLYRAKSKQNKEVTGWFFKTSKEWYIIPISNNFFYVEIKPETLAVHHPEMIAADSYKILPNGEKDLRIFLAVDEKNIMTASDILLSDNMNNTPSYLYFQSYETIPYFMSWDSYAIIKADNV